MIERQGHGDARSTFTEQSLVRALLFLRTVSTDPAVRAAMTTTGFRDRDADEGWRLLRAACSTPLPAAAPKRSAVREAARELDAFARTMLPRARAVTRRLHPEYESILFGVSEKVRSGTAAVAVFVERCDALRRSPKRKATRARDAAVLAALASRGVTTEALEAARRSVAIATGRAAPIPARAAKNRAALDDLHAWVRDWSDCARTAITRRDWLIRLGIGRRRKRPKKVTAGSR